MILLLKYIASIQTGLFAKPLSTGDLVYLQARDFDESGNLIARLQPVLLSNCISQKHFLKPGDILFSAKGVRNFATVFETGNLPTVASTSFFVIRLNESLENGILPEFLTWFLNHPDTLSFLKSQAMGSSMVSISKSVLEDLEIPFPALKIQRTILKIIQLRNQEKKLIQRIDALREKQIQQKILGAINYEG